MDTRRRLSKCHSNLSPFLKVSGMGLIKLVLMLLVMSLLISWCKIN